MQRLGSLIANYELSEEPVGCIFEVAVSCAEKKQRTGSERYKGSWRSVGTSNTAAFTAKGEDKKQREATNIARRCEPPTDAAAVSRGAARIDTVKDEIRNKNRNGI
jgi:hypothetical protein